MTGPRTVVVVGAGITGLAAAHRVLELARGRHALDVKLLDGAGRVGGHVLTGRVGRLQVELGADSFVVRKPWAVELCRELGLEDRVVIPGATGASVWTAGGLATFPERSAFGVPASALELLRWPGMSLRGRVRSLGDLVRPPRRSHEDEALGSLARRRLGAEAAGALVEPLLGGLHAADPEQQSVLATFPELAAWERDHGSLLRAARRALRTEDERGRGKKPLFATLWGGLDLLTGALAERIGSDRIGLDERVSSLTRRGNGYLVGTEREPVHAGGVLLATPAFESARLLSHLNPEAAGELSGISYASTAVVVLVYPEGTADRLPGDGTGFVVGGGGRTVTACTWYSRKWPDEAFGERAVLRCFVGRAGADEALRLADEELVAAVHQEVQEVTPMGAVPEASRVVRWVRSMPQYEVGHLDRLARIDGALEGTPGIFVAGSAYRGVGIADCVRQGREAAERVVAHLDGPVAEAEAGGARESMTWTS